MEQLLPGIDLVNGDCAAVLPGLAAADLILTSPPYDGLRDYGGYAEAFDFPAVAAAVAGNLKPGGVLVWVVRDAVVDGGETGTSFRQALDFLGLGLRLHQTLIYQHWTVAGMRRNAYFRDIEYMFVFSKGIVNANLLQDKPNIQSGLTHYTGRRLGRQGDVAKYESIGAYVVPEMGRRGSVWCYGVGNGAGNNNGDLPTSVLNSHPAIFPVALARDHILSWTNPGDLVIDPMAGSGTSLRAAADLGRRAIGIEINPDYCGLIRQRLAQAVLPLDSSGQAIPL